MKNLLFKTTDNLMLAIFRLAYGLLMGIHCMMSLWNGQVYRNFVEPPFRFPYIQFEFLNFIPGEAFYWVFILMSFSSLMIFVGYRYRLFSFVLALMWTLTYLSQKMDYNNHYYLMVLVGWIMFIVPAHQRLSLDVKHGRVRHTTHVEQWVPALFISLAVIMYTYAGFSKIDEDWLSGRFLDIMFSRYRHHPYWGNLYSDHSFALFISWGGLAFDLLIAPALLWRKTRLAAFLLACCFHLFNAYTFQVGIFPFLGIALNLFFFTPLYFQSGSESSQRLQAPITLHARTQLRRRIITVGFSAFILIQVLLPLRQYLFPGNTFWTEEGYRMSWKMMGRTKSGWVRFKVTTGDGQLLVTIDPSQVLSRTHHMWLAGSPDMIWQYAQRIKRKYRSTNSQDVKVYALGEVSMNRRPLTMLVDSATDLAHTKWEPFKHSQWIVPMKR